MRGKQLRQPYAPASFLRMFLSLASYRVPMPVTELKVFPDCRGKPAYYVCPRCRLTMEREYMGFCDRCGQRLDWRDSRHARIIYPDEK